MRALSVSNRKKLSFSLNYDRLYIAKDGTAIGIVNGKFVNDWNARTDLVVGTSSEESAGTGNGTIEVNRFEMYWSISDLVDWTIICLLALLAYMFNTSSIIVLMSK